MPMFFPADANRARDGSLMTDTPALRGQFSSCRCVILYADERARSIHEAMKEEKSEAIMRAALQADGCRRNGRNARKTTPFVDSQPALPHASKRYHYTGSAAAIF